MESYVGWARQRVRSAADHCQHQVAGRHVLAISDRSDMHLQAQARHLKAEDIGVVGNHHDIGFFLHILAFMVTLRLLPLHIGRADESLSASVAFSEPQQQCLEPLMPTLQGRTRKQQNPFSPGSLPWATGFMARLGGWSGYRSQPSPGIRTLSQGLRKFEAIFEGWSLALSSFVCT